MITDRAPKERQINSFRTPFDIDSTPYKLEDFPYIVKDFCRKAKQQPKLKIAKTIFIGDVGVGKTSLINRFREKVFSTRSNTTVGVDCFLEGFDVLGVPFNVQIWDTAGQERFRSIASPYFRGTAVIVLVFDLSNIYSLQNCEQWLETALQASSPDNQPYIVIVGNKLDGISPAAYEGMKEIAVSLAKKLTAEYWVVSSKTGENVDNFFRRLAVLAFEWMVLKELSGVTDHELVKLVPTKVAVAPYTKDHPSERDDQLITNLTHSLQKILCEAMTRLKAMLLEEKELVHAN